MNNFLIFIVNVALICAVFGLQAHPKSYPYHVSVHNAVDHFCSGSIISERFILSAAVCFKENTDNDNSILDLTVHAGSSSKSNGSIHHIKRIILHENFQYNEEFGTSRHNLALIELQEPFVFDENHQPIELFEENEELKSNKTGVVSGWPMDELGRRPEQLMATTVTIVDQKTCDNAYNEFHKISENEVCAAKDNLKYFDWGSPLVVDGRLVGVGSWDVAGFGGVDSPKVFTSVIRYRNWIKKQAQLA